MSKSFRLDPAMEKRLEQVARAQGVPVSALIREAVSRHCDDIADHSLRAELADVIGCVDSSGGRARRSGHAFKKLLDSGRRK